MAKEVIEIDVKTNIVGESVTDLRKQFAEVEDALFNMAGAGKQNTEEFRNLQREAGKIKERIDDLNESIDMLKPEAKFQAVANIGAGIASGFAAAQGAMQLFGAESESVEKALLKVQAAMALSQGIEGVIAMGDSFKVMKAVALDALKGIKTGIAATGIGLFVVALGTVVAYWDDIKAAVSGVSEEQKELNNLTDLNVNQEKEKLTELNSQDNVLKLQGLSEKEILNLKIKQTNEVIAATEQQIKQKQITSKLEIEAAERNANITKQILRGAMEINTVVLRAMAAPIDLLLTTANAVSEKLGLGQITAINLNKKISELNEFVGKTVGDLLFDPESVKADAKKTLAESEKSLKELINQRAGYQLQINQIDKTAAEKKTQKDLEDAEKWRQEQAKFIQYELDAFANKFGEEEQIIAEQQLATKIALGIATPDEVEAYQKEINARKLKAEKEYNDAVDAELKRLKEKEDKRRADEDAKIKAEYDRRLEGFKQLELQKVEWAKQGLTLISDLNTLFAGQSEAEQRRAFEIDKGVKIASATISGIEGTINAYSTAQKSPITAVLPAYPAIQAGIAAAFAAVNIAKIASTQFKSSGGASSGGGASNLGTFSQGGGGVQAPGLTSQNNVTQLNPDGSVAGQGNREMQPVKAYVVESESRAVTDRVNKLSNQSKIG